MKHKSQIIVYSSLVIAMIFWSLSFIWYKMVFNFFEPITVVLFRLIISSIFLFSILYLTKRLQKIQRKDYTFFLILGLFEPFLYFLAESYGIKFVSSTLAAVIISTIPIFNAIAAYHYFKEKLTKMNIAGIIFSFMGVLLVIFSNVSSIGSSSIGITLMFIAVIAAIGYSVMIKKLADNYNALNIVAYENFIGIFLFAPLFFILDFKGFQANGGLSLLSNPKALIPLIELGVFASSIAFVFFTYGIQKLGITKANIFSNIIPVCTAIFAYFFLDEEITIYKIIGIIIVVVGLFLSQIKNIPLRNMFTPKITHRY